MYDFEMYDIPVIMLLTNNITNFFGSKMSKNRVILRVVCTCNLEGLEEVEKMARN